MTQPAADKQQLQQAFDLFNQVSEQLTDAWQALQQQVVSLNDELAAAAVERQQQLDEITALRQKLTRSQRLSAMGEMTARLAHQIRTPLSTSLLYASNLKQPGLRPDQHACFVDRLLSGLRHLDHMVNDMLVFTGAGQGGEEAVSVENLLERVQEFLLPQLIDQSAQWSVVAPQQTTMIHARREILTSMLVNLASNAMQAAGEGVRLDWEISIQDDEVHLVLQDNGPGVAETVRENIFDPFFTTRSSGTGLGLAVVRAVVIAHGGSIDLDGDYQHGARFVIRLPLSPKDKQLPSGILKNRTEQPEENLRCV